MTEERNRTAKSDQRTPIAEPCQVSSPIDRRQFFHSLGLLTAGGLSSTVGLAQTSSPRDSATAAESADAVGSLELQTRRAQRWAGYDPTDWVRPRPGVDHNVVIVGEAEKERHRNSSRAQAQRRWEGRSHRRSRTRPGRRLADDRTDAQPAHSKDSHRPRATQPDVGLPRVV